MIEKIKISGFKRISNLSINDLNQINIFYGGNGQGKSSVLEAITWAIVGGKIDSTKAFLNNKTDEMRVSVITDRAMIERSYIEGQKKDKLSATTLGGDRIEDAEKKLAMMYPVQAFDPTVFVTMDSKSISALVRKCMADKVALTDDEKEEIGYNQLPIAKIEKTANDVELLDLAETFWYDLRTERGRVLKQKSAGANAVNGEKVPIETIKKMEELRDSVKAEVVAIEEKNAKIAAAKRSAATLGTLKARKEELIDKIDAFSFDEEFDIESATKRAADLKAKANEILKQYTDNNGQFEILKKTIAELGSAEQIVCPLSKSVKCTTDMSPYIKKMKAELKSVETDTKTNHAEYSAAMEDLKVLESTMRDYADHQNLLAELKRTNSVIESLGDVEEEDEIDVSARRSELEEMSVQIARARAALDFDDSEITRAQEAYDEADAFVEAARQMKDRKSAEMKINIKGLEVGAEGITFRGINIKNECTSFQMRMGVAIIRELFPRLNLLVIDRLETLDDSAIAAFVETISKTNIQVFAAHVGSIPKDLGEAVSAYEMDKGVVK